jgi:nitric oxide reductase subunit B
MPAVMGMMYMEVQEQLILFYWMRLGAGAFVALAVLLYVWSVLGPVHEERPARMDVAPQRPAPAE